MRDIKYVLHKEGKYYVSRSLNIEVSSFGKTPEEAVSNLKEALELYFEDAPKESINEIHEEQLGKIAIAV